MADLSETSIEAVELETVRDDIPDLMLTEDTFYSRSKKAGRVLPMSTSTGGGPGSAYAAQFLLPVAFAEACEITAQAVWSSDSGKKSRINVKATEYTNTLEQFKSNLDAAMQGDGSGTLDTVVLPASGGGAAGPSFSNTTVVNANQFFDNQVVQVFPAVGGVARGSFQISFVDGVTNTLWSADALPPGMAAGDILVINGATGAAGTSIMGIRSYQVNGNGGTLNGLA